MLRPPLACLARASRPASPLCNRPAARRGFSDKESFRTPQGKIKVNLAAKQLVGVAQSRGERPYQEDAYSVHALHLPVSALKQNALSEKAAAGWTPASSEDFEEEDPPDGGERRKQVAYFAVFDGHGGDQVSKMLKERLHGLVEGAKVTEVQAEVDKYRAIGNFFRRYRGGILDRFKEPQQSEGDAMALDEMATLAFLKADNEVLDHPEYGKGGSVGTVAFLHSLDTHALPHHLSTTLLLTIAHLGDTRAILASTSSGRAVALTQAHHPDSRIESQRLRQMGTGIVTDSFGESRWGGGLANTRGIGDREFKELGVTGEPEVTKKVLKGEEWAFLAIMSDGISDSMTNQEVIDLCRGSPDPTTAAKRVVSFAESVGGEDNMTVIIVPFLGWSKMGGSDTTSARREYRLRQVSSQSSRQKRM